MQLIEGLIALWRRDGESQLGSDPRLAVVLAGLSREQQRALDLLAGAPVTAAGLVRASGASQSEVAELLDRLGQLGVLREGAATARGTGRGRRRERSRPSVLRSSLGSRTTPVDRSGRAVAVLGGHPLALAVARLLAAAGVGAVAVLDPDVVTANDVSVLGYHPGDVGSPRSSAAIAHLRHARPDVDTRPPAHPDVVVLVESRVSVPFRSSGLVREDVTHLSVVLRELDVTVGPAVRPGRDACLRCLDLHRTAADPCWPALATQLAVAPAPHHEGATIATAAGLAVAAVLAILDGDAGAPWQHSAEVGGPQVPRRRWAPHPDCGCGAHEHRSVTRTTGARHG